MFLFFLSFFPIESNGISLQKSLNFSNFEPNVLKLSIEGVYVYTRANAMKILPCFDARIHMYNRSCNDAEKILRRPRGDSVDVHVSLTRSMPRMTVDDFFFFFSSLFPFLLYHSRERSRSPCEVKITRRLMGLNIWKGENAIIHEGEKILHGIKRVDEIMMADKDT